MLSDSSMTYPLETDLLEAPQASSAILLAVDKPDGWTSFDVVKKLRYASGLKAGHSGTLDPRATGLLLVGLGRGTKRLGELQALDKGYEGAMRLGAVTASYDGETRKEPVAGADQLIARIDQVQLQQVADRFVGDIEQLPPAYSAVKVHGKRLYKRARKGETVLLPPRHVHVDRFEITRWQAPDARFEVDCGSGTYIRSLVHDLGQNLGTGAWMSQLNRTRIGPYRLEDAWNLERLVERLRILRGESDSGEPDRGESDREESDRGESDRGDKSSDT
jgi:tRNA pseudouridine55 synthase